MGRRLFDGAAEEVGQLPNEAHATLIARSQVLLTVGSRLVTNLTVQATVTYTLSASARVVTRLVTACGNVGGVNANHAPTTDLRTTAQ